MCRSSFVYRWSNSFCSCASESRMGSFCGQTASHLPQRTQCRAFSLSGKRVGPLGLDGVRLAEHAQLVPDAEIVRDVHPHGAGHTVAAAGAANFDAAVQLVGHAVPRRHSRQGRVVRTGQRWSDCRPAAPRHSCRRAPRARWGVRPPSASAQEASLASECRARSGAAASAGRAASVPPLMGSMMTSGTPHSSVSW